LWPAGTRIDFGGALAEITAARLVAIIRLFRP
jgi:hypothetical protein